MLFKNQREDNARSKGIKVYEPEDSTSVAKKVDPSSPKAAKNSSKSKTKTAKDVIGIKKDTDKDSDEDDELEEQTENKNSAGVIRDDGDEFFDKADDIKSNLNLNFENSNLVKKIMTLVCMLGTKNEKYSKKVMEQLIDRFYAIRTQAKFDEKIKQVIFELTNSIPQEKVFMEFANNLESLQDLGFVVELIDRLTLLILAQPNYAKLRKVLMG